MKLTKKLAKKHSLLKWNWLKENPITLMSDSDPIHKMDSKIVKVIERYEALCPLCDLYNKVSDDTHNTTCIGCPLNIHGLTCFDDTHLYQKYDRATKKQRKIIAQKIIDILEAWDV